jgi:starch synthase (maltosyl-transferring)
MYRDVSFPANEMGRHFHVNGITVNKTIQSVESAVAGGAFRVADMYAFSPLVRCQA